MEDGFIGNIVYVDFVECLCFVKEMGVDVLVVVLGLVYG